MLAGRRLLLVTVLGSSMAFLDATVVNVALPHIGASLDTGLGGLQWVLDAYLLTFTALVLLGGVLGDRHGRLRVFLVGVYGFSAASLLCGLAPNVVALVAARALQGAAAAVLVPGSLALLTSSTDPADRSRAVGAWSGLTAVAGAVGPLVGGWLVDALSWRWIFFVNLPLAATIAIAVRGLPESGSVRATTRLDLSGAAAVAAALAMITAALIGHGSTWALPVAVGGVAAFALFIVIEIRSEHPMLPLGLFRSVQFSGANTVTLAVYTGLGAATFLVVVNLQVALGYSAVEAGAAMLPVTVLLIALSSQAGKAAQRIGPTLPMTLGPVLSGLGLAGLASVGPGSSYLTGVFPAVCLLGLGLAITVAPLTAVVLAAVRDEQLGLGSGVNNAVARLAGLVGVAVIPTVAGVDLAAAHGASLPGYRTSLLIAGALCLAGGAIALFTVRRVTPVRPTIAASVIEPCHDPCRLEAGAATAVR